mgnify:CR=1 FL=1
MRRVHEKVQFALDAAWCARLQWTWQTVWASSDTRAWTCSGWVHDSSMTFALFFLAEYCSMILMSVLTIIIFVGG